MRKIVLAIAILALALVVFFVWRVNNLSAQGVYHNEWSEWQAREWSVCRARGVPKCNETGYVVGTQSRERRRMCVEVRGRGQSVCRIGQQQHETQNQRCRIRVRVCEPEPTTRLCHWEENGFEAIAVTKVARQRHLNAHDLDKAWEEGMDAQCEFPPEPEVPEVPEVPVQPRGTTQASAPICSDGVPAVVPQNAHVIRNGPEATVNAHIPEGSVAHIYFRENDEADWRHAARDIPVVGGYVSHTIRDLDPNVGYTFGVQAANSCAGGEIVLAVIVDPPAFGVTFPFSYWEWLR